MTPRVCCCWSCSNMKCGGPIPRLSQGVIMPMKQVSSDMNVSQVCKQCCLLVQVNDTNSVLFLILWPNEVEGPSQDCPKVLSCPWNKAAVIWMYLRCVSHHFASWWSAVSPTSTDCLHKNQECVQLVLVATWSGGPIPRLSQGVIMPMKQVSSDISVSEMCISPCCLLVISCQP